MAQQISESELILMKIIWRQDILSADELKEIELFWRKENE